MSFANTHAFKKYIAVFSVFASATNVTQSVPDIFFYSPCSYGAVKAGESQCRRTAHERRRIWGFCPQTPRASTRVVRHNKSPPQVQLKTRNEANCRPQNAAFLD